MRTQDLVRRHQPPAPAPDVAGPRDQPPVGLAPRGGLRRLRPVAPDIAWAVFAGLNLAAMRLFPAWQTVPFLAIWVSLTVIYGFRLWRLQPTILTLAAVTDTKTYDATTNSTGAVSVTGLKGSDTVTGARQSFDSQNAGSRTLSVGGYTVNDGNNGGNYTISTMTAAGAITPAALTVTASDTGKPVGQADPVLTYAVSGGTLFGADSLTGKVTRDPGESVGAYAITQGSLAASGNYIITFRPGTFTITNLALQNGESENAVAAHPALSLVDFEPTTPSGGPGAVSPTCFTTEDGGCVNTPYPDNANISAGIHYESH